MNSNNVYCELGWGFMEILLKVSAKIYTDVAMWNCNVYFKNFKVKQVVLAGFNFPSTLMKQFMDSIFKMIFTLLNKHNSVPCQGSPACQLCSRHPWQELIQKVLDHHLHRHQGQPQFLRHALT